MLPYYRDPDSHWEWQVLSLAGVPRNEWGVLFLIVVLLGLAISSLIESIIKELYRVYQTHAFKKTRTAKALWTALAVFGVICLIAFMMILAGDWQGFYLFSWSFLIYVLVVEGYDWYEGRKAPQEALEANDVDVREVLQPWTFSIQREE